MEGPIFAQPTGQYRRVASKLNKSRYRFPGSVSVSIHVVPVNAELRQQAGIDPHTYCDSLRCTSMSRKHSLTAT
jgi:hypothetical protein